MPRLLRYALTDGQEVVQLGFDTYGEFPAGLTGVAVQDGVGSQLGCAQDHIVGDRAFTE